MKTIYSSTRNAGTFIIEDYFLLVDFSW